MLYMMALPKWLASRPRTKKCSTLVMHATAGGSLSGALDTLIKRNFSYHYIIDKSGYITKCVATTRIAYHAGKSIGPEGPNVNLYSIGISFVNRNNGRDPYTKAQINAASELIRLLTDCDCNIKYLTTHRQISWPRKNDPVASAGFLQDIAIQCKLKFWERKGVPN